MSFSIAFQKLIVVERGYSNHPSDTGGKTMYGITEAVARAHGYGGEMRDLRLETARDIYRAQYWDTLRLTDIAALSYPIAEEVFDTGVNMGIGHAGRFLQRALNAFNRQQKDYADLIADGVVGPVTVWALKAFLDRRGKDGEIVMLRALNAQQGERYLQITENRPANEDFFYGWLLKRVT